MKDYLENIRILRELAEILREAEYEKFANTSISAEIEEHLDSLEDAFGALYQDLTNDS